MNFRVVDEHGRQLGMGRNLAALKAELGGQARGLPGAGGAQGSGGGTRPPNSGWVRASPAPQAGIRRSACRPPAAGGPAGPIGARRRPAPRSQAYTAWTFGELPELMEIRKGGHTLIGFPALIDKGDTCRDRGLRRARGGRVQAPRRPAPAGGAADQGAAEVPGKEHPRSAEDGVAYMSLGTPTSCAPDHRRGAGPRLLADPCPPTRPASRRAWPKGAPA
jgi:ATP-dependent helicase HrpA